MFRSLESRRFTRRQAMVGAGAGAFALGTGRFARAQSATPAAGIKQSLDISYATRSGSDPNLTRLDVCAPDGARDLPVMVFVHGGGWRRGEHPDPVAVALEPTRAPERDGAREQLPLAFVHPATGVRAEYSSQYPADLAAALDAIRD